MYKLCNGEQLLTIITIIDQSLIIQDGKIQINQQLNKGIILNQIGLLKNKLFTIIKPMSDSIIYQKNKLINVIKEIK